MSFAKKALQKAAEKAARAGTGAHGVYVEDAGRRHCRVCGRRFGSRLGEVCERPRCQKAYLRLFGE